MSNLPIPLAHTTREVVCYRRYGCVNPFCCDPVEKKPFFHTLPGIQGYLENPCPSECGNRLIERL